MLNSSPFSRSIAMMAAIAAAAGFSNQGMRESALADIGPYESRGKGKGGGNRRAPGAQMAGIRAARKTRNVKRHRAHCRG